MTPLDSESGLWLLASVPNLQVILDEAVNYLPIAGMFLVGIWIGYLFFGKRKPESGDVIAADMARLEAELDAARIRDDQRESELHAFQDQTTRVRQDFEDEQEQLEEATGLLESVLTQPESHAGLARVRLPVMRLAKTIRAERQRIVGGLARSQGFEKRLACHRAELESLSREMGEIRSRLRKDTNPETKKVRSRIRSVDESLRVLIQNVSGCLQRISGASGHLEVEQEKLGRAAQDCREIESMLPADPEAIEESAAKAAEKLQKIRTSAIGSLSEGIDQEIAEMTGRIGWVIEDSPQKLLKAFDELTEEERAVIGESSFRLTEIRESLEATRLALQSDPILDSSPSGCGRRRLEEAVDQAVSELKTATESTAAEPANRPELEGTVAHLQRQLSLREDETARLHEELKERDEELESLRSRLDKQRKRAGRRAGSTSGGGRGFVRRLLGLGPGQTSAAETRAETPPPAATLAEAREILHELKVSTASGNGGNPAPAAVAAETVTAVRPVPLVAPAKDSEPDPDSVAAVESKAELEELRARLSGQQARIQELELENSKLRQAERKRLLTVAEPPSSPSLAAATKSTLGPFSGVQAGDSIETENEIVLFRGRDLSNWDTKSEGPDDSFAIPLKEVPETIRYLRLRRLDTGDSIVVPISREELLAGASASGKGFGWSGKGERYFGGYHFGIYDESVPREVETKFGVGGWGFGHRASIDSEQAFGWAGKRIPPTDFEITVGGDSGLDPVEAPAPVSDPESEPKTIVEAAPETEAQPKAVVGQAGLIIFRSKDPEIWNQTVYHGANHRSRAIDDLPDDVSWLRIRRLPEENSVIVPITKAGLTNDGEGLTYGFNGSNEVFYGARHLGAFAENLPQEVETRFTYGGWGFGHRPSGLEEQACAWEGREAPAESVFEVTVYREKPEIYEPFDRVLGEPR